MPSISKNDAFGYHSTNGLGHQILAQAKQYISARVRPIDLSEVLRNIDLPKAVEELDLPKLIAENPPQQLLEHPSVAQILQHPEVARFLGNVDLVQLIQSPEVVEFLQKPEVNEFLKNTKDITVLKTPEAKKLITQFNPSLFVTKEVIDDRLKNHRLSLRRITILANLVKALSYLPIIGTIIGIAGLVLLGKYEKQALKLVQDCPETQKAVKSLIRGLRIRLAIATTSLGIGLAIPDVIYSLKKRS